MALSKQQIEQFLEDGFLVVEQVFTPAEMNEVETGFDRAYQAAEKLIRDGRVDQEHRSVEEGGSRFTFQVNDDDTVVRHIAMVGNLIPELLRLGTHPAILELMADLLGSDKMARVINQAHFKRPGSGVAFAWHQDSRHRGIHKGKFQDLNGRGSYVQSALAIDDVTPDNGPLSFIRGSNRHGHIDDGEVGEQYLPEDKIVRPLLKRGDLALFGPYTIHGSEANVSDSWRRVFINGYAYPEALIKGYGLPRVGEEVTR